MRLLVTGGAGFIGSHLVEALLARGHRVIVLDDLSSGKRANLPASAELTVGSASDIALVDRLVLQADGVFHLAARVSVQDCIQQWEQGHEDNLIAAMRVFQAAVAAGGVPVVYASSAAVYGDQLGRLCTEDLREMPISPYGADKLACEHQARAFYATHGLSTFGLRFFNVYGPRQDASSSYAGVISRFAANVMGGSGHVVFGDGLQSRDFVNIRDVTAGLLAAMEVVRDRGGAQVANLCTGQGTTLLDLIAALDVTMGSSKRTPVRHEPARAGDIQHSLGSCDRMASLLGMKAGVNLEEGLADLLRSTRTSKA